MENLPGKTELQRLEEERDAIQVCLAVCEAARIHVDQASERNKDPQTSTEDVSLIDVEKFNPKPKDPVERRTLRRAAEIPQQICKEIRMRSHSLW
ncbi:hypothetical protein GGTG_14277 [Gaeumannomyces tritici R3-111a-1]|uniref:Uncharacterized protein n=1 Tax=Gaeumannomyces tritici (strain R3-111a-1) TaxID=644352 RepID=J3PL33_GAET3|nr:hypothetical protein GGTG_14277 [Gaeumannomyces tritici R3-111a-1]EJT68145.1 hypothetical protein GGTG_14277 [Gaeumannomyces tritici R3-111a-1]